VLNVPLNAADGTPVTVPADDLHGLAAQLALDQPTADGGEFLLRGVVQTFRFYALDRRRRIAALALLATAPGLRYRGPAVDRAGRPGVAFTITSGAYATGQLEDLVIIDPTDGRLLDHEQIALSFPPRVLAASPATVSYTLILAADTTDRMP
ncbi:MAG: hypothetical protein HOV83_22845, partial [Catenulispora sp.]|nr:hypothetical protein [Catenulispora sp.]